MGETTKRGETKFWNFSGGKQKEEEHDFWLKFSGVKSWGNYENDFAWRRISGKI